MITYNDLEGFYYLEKLIKWYEEKIKELETKNRPLWDSEKELLKIYNKHHAESVAKYAEIQVFITNIPDDYLRGMFVDRYVKLKSWRSVALNRNLSEECVKKMHTRYLKKYIKEQSTKIGE